MSAQGKDERMHELLPWYVAGTLAQPEVAAFRAHLDGCEACRREIGTFEDVRQQVERHGEAFFDEHPSPDRLIGSIRGNLDDATAASVALHLRICAACATEVRWIRGDASTDEPDLASPTPASGNRKTRAIWMPLLAAAAGLVLGLLLPFGGTGAPGSGPAAPVFVAPIERAGEAANRVERTDRGPARLMLEVDFGPASFPLRLEITDGSGAPVARASIAPEQLYDETYLYYDCSRNDCPPGRYVLTLRATDDVEPEVTIPFEVVEP